MLDIRAKSFFKEIYMLVLFFTCEPHFAYWKSIPSQADHSSGHLFRWSRFPNHL